MSTRWQQVAAARGDEYDARWQELAAAGHNIHGEADLVQTLLESNGGRRVLDAGCGTGRVAAELAGRGFDVVGVDADEQMLDTARGRDANVEWVNADLARLHGAVSGGFDLILLAGNVMIFLEPGTEDRVLGAMAARLRPGGLLVAGFSRRDDALSLDTYDRLAAAKGLALQHRWSTWERDRFDGGDYAVTVHRR